jgi:WD40-like Beta Propeller Repeat
LKPLVRLDVDLGRDVALNALGGSDVIISPDGTRIAYLSRGHLFTRKFDQPAATELTVTAGSTSPFFSPDGQWVAFIAGGKVRKISVEGGAEISLCDAAASYTGADWGEDGNIIASLRVSGGLSRVSSTGGTPPRSPNLRVKNGLIAGRKSCPAPKRSCSPRRIPPSALTMPKLKW